MRRLGYAVLAFALLLGMTACGTAAPSGAGTPSAGEAQPAATAAEKTELPEEVFTGFTAEDFLHTEGKEIVNGLGEKVYLRGTNAGGWLVQEAWMTPTNADCQLVTLDTFDRRFGEETRNTLLDAYMDNFLTGEDLDLCRDMGMTVIRLPFWYRNLVDAGGEPLPEAFSRMDWFVEACSERGMYVILDMHGAPGSQNGNDHSGDNTSGARLWEEEALQDLTVKVWEMVAAHYRGNPAVAAYDLLNEPAANDYKTNKTQWDLFDRLYKAIRAIDPEHIIMMESCWEPTNLPHPADYGWENIVYQYHTYVWDADHNDSRQIQGHRNKLWNIRYSGHQVPVLMGEFTLFRAEEAWHTVLQEYNEAGLHWTTWTLKTTGKNNSWGILNLLCEDVRIKTDPEEEILRKWETMREGQQVNIWLHNILINYLPGNPLAAAGRPMEAPEIAETPVPEQTVEALVYNAVEDEATFAAGEEAIAAPEDVGGISAVKLVCTQSADPGTDRGCVIFYPEKGEAADATGYAWLIFYIRDMQGANTHRLTIVDADGGMWSGWVETSSVYRKWTRIAAPLAAVNGVDLSAVKEIRIGEWNSGTYYIDSLFFTAQESDTAAGLTLPEIGT
ncbi:MAG: glycoside hydrolase family 5 protein [Christensenellales bacterium]